METYDVIIVGGGPAGLAGALTLARARRSVLVVDNGTPRNAAAGHVHNFLTRDGTPPAELLAIGRAEVEGYGATFATGTATGAKATADSFTLTLDDGRTFKARRLLVTTGLADELPDIPGLAGRLGSDVLHCPYCHGWEVRDQAIGIIATTAAVAHVALLWRQWSADVTVVLNGQPAPTGQDAALLAARGITLVDDRVTALDPDRTAHLAGGATLTPDVWVVPTRMTARDDLLTDLGVETGPVLMGDIEVGVAVKADANGATSVPGVWVAGNVTDLRAQVIVSAAAGLNAGAMINADLAMADAHAAARVD
ncbi:putative FAD-dependent pyridine nucleotide-disulphide oxidoreductase [Asanoa ishikariensis]|uniref:Thioredoxin reductase (NADPH) n=1 Tax=Asanoa ishikariensis TaxID=137265 RepID=A0A1H3T7P7_9ACTN|nr:NAD(P)/FAD-dependent oxidoreductase [Asanoa ishikariensis]GIF62930.1 putative FAD-dependent pyridine nucleotide-disulphide oxidoreductase [Asanoa ishikariensis]SDZ45881.1 thioredoxin reductase (NADPH) [Asanoa ishikariensis]